MRYSGSNRIEPSTDTLGSSFTTTSFEFNSGQGGSVGHISFENCNGARLEFNGCSVTHSSIIAEVPWITIDSANADNNEVGTEIVT